MTEYINIPPSAAGQNFPRPSQPYAYGRPDTSYGQSTSIPRVTRVSYGTTGAATTANRPSWGTNAPLSPYSASRPTSTSPLAAADPNATHPGPNSPVDPRPRKPSRSLSSRAYGQQSPTAPVAPPDPLSLPNSPPPRPWTAMTNPDVGRPTASWVSGSFPAHPESILAPDSPYPLHPPPSRMPDREVRNMEQKRPELFRREERQEPQSYFDQPSPRTSDRDSRSGGSQPESIVVSEDMAINESGSFVMPEREPVVQVPQTPYRMEGNAYTPTEQPKRPGMGKRFVGGFVAGFKKIPKAMSKNHPREAVPPAMPVPQLSPPTNPTPAARYENPPYEIHPPVSAQLEHIQLRTSDFTTSTGTGTTSSSSARRGPATPPNLPNPSARREPTIPLNLPNPYEPPIDLQTPASIASPVEVHPPLASDYDAMTEPTEDPEEESLNTRANRVGKFVKDFTHLPWISGRVSEEYQPAQSHRAQVAKPAGSWYTQRGHTQLDLLAGPAPVKPRTQERSRAVPQQTKQPRPRTRPKPQRRPTGESEGITAIRPTRTPASGTSGGIQPISPGASSHGQGSHSYAYSYYYPTPQPMYVYPSAVSPQHRRSDGPSGTPLPDVQQAVPVYMLATPAPLMLPASPNHRSPRHHRSTHHHSIPKATSPTSPRKA
ncbi:hypothetical protein EIP91_008976 [Steccherinum ochraceum]|uniref:Uncharacterized protein n=1 Tax=Steccherinum ochraceum TaxID=92696 RepID=A0A4R0RY18_9APHY|nr:hypothetical protein EIP91_008976 [Steccherinum ochraceum]